MIYFYCFVCTDMMKVPRQWTLASPNSLLTPGMGSQMALTLPSLLMALVKEYIYFYIICE